MESVLNQLISIPSQSGSESNIIFFISQWLKQHGIEVKTIGGNCIAFIKGTDSTKCLILSGHVDTVEPGDIDDWASDPFIPSKIKGKIYGLGTSDMKSGVAVLMKLAEYYAKKTPECDLTFAFVTGEEVDGSGSQKFIDWFIKKHETNPYKSVEAVIAEPTDLKELEIGHRGNYFITITIHSSSGHGSLPQSHTSAIPISATIITDLFALNKKWTKIYKNKDLGSPSIAITGLKAGNFESPNKIPGESTIQLDIRTTTEIHNSIPLLLKEFLAKYPIEFKMHTIESPPGFTNANSTLRKIFTKSWPDIDHKTMQGSSDLCYFVKYGIPAVLFGPGQKDRIHNSNEFVTSKNLDKFFEAMKLVVWQYGK